MLIKFGLRQVYGHILTLGTATFLCVSMWQIICHYGRASPCRDMYRCTIHDTCGTWQNTTWESHRRKCRKRTCCKSSQTDCFRVSYYYRSIIENSNMCTIFTFLMIMCIIVHAYYTCNCPISHKMMFAIICIIPIPMCWCRYLYEYRYK